MKPAVCSRFIRVTTRKPTCSLWQGEFTINAYTLVRVLAVAVTLPLLLGQGRAALAGSEGNLEDEVGTVIADVLSAWRHADAHAIAAQYEPDGDFISPTGDHATGRPAIEAFYEAAFNAGYAGSGATAKVLHARRIGAQLALIDGSWSIDPTPVSRITGPESGLFAVLLHRQGGRWRIVALREQTSAQQLRELSAGPGH